MSPQAALVLGQEALQIALLVAAPILAAALITGLIVSIFQAATQINEMTLSFIPKLVAIFGVAIVSGPWMLETLQDYMRRLFSSIPTLIG